MEQKTLSTPVWTITALISTYILCQAVADIGATKLVSVAGIVIPGGTFVFTVTFTLRDMLHKRLGKNWARASIIMAGILNLFMAGYLTFIARLPAPPFYGFDQWDSIFAFVPAITLGSIAAEVVSELVDTEVYSIWKNRLPKAPQWSRVLVSNAVSLPVDSLIFATLAFVVLPPLFGQEALPFSAALALVGGQIIFKAIVTVISMPFIYLVKDEPVDLVAV